MGFYEDIAEALDSEDIESRIAEDTLFVPIAPELEIQFSLIQGVGAAESIQAANVFVAMADVSDEDEQFDAALVGVVFSVEAAVREVAKYMAMDQVISVLNELLEGDDERLDELEFEQDPYEPFVVYASVGEDSVLIVELSSEGAAPTGNVSFVTYGDDFDELLEQATEELIEDDEDVTESEKQEIFRSAVADVGEQTREVLELGTFEDFEAMFDALAVAAQQAYDWEEMLVPLDDRYEFDLGDDEDDDDDEEDFFPEDADADLDGEDLMDFDEDDE
ncbi:hypothetical protein ACUY3M_04105 [Corynebacterium suicordis]|uniref:DNA primase n=1 Tax=Corynebacterium suicordis DSM 45110 TaxID=1121369 RepID=A0ABR9ZIQ7_9CORY|nr:hypothetical protein [Corynebacterium suicordis]MBF4553264.1 hypothetical protein [Corynebacterium suicordis DSM 45110]MDR6277766.1 hypothetical protein [Corynebacterium suicordis]